MLTCLIFEQALRGRRERDRVGDDDLVERRLDDALDGRAREDAVRRAGDDARGAVIHERLAPRR